MDQNIKERTPRVLYNDVNLIIWMVINNCALKKVELNES